MNPIEQPYLILVDHSTAAMHVLDDIRDLGFRILYLGREPRLAREADRAYAMNPLSETPRFLEEQGEELKRLPIAGVCTFLEHAKFSERQIAQYLGKAAIPLEVLVHGRDKHSMRQILRQAGLPSIEFHFIPDSDVSPKALLPFPFIVKPNLGYASGGVQLIRSSESFKAAISTIRRLNRFVLGQGYFGQSGAICEEYVEGPEFSIDSISVGGQTRSFCFCGRGFPGEGNFQDYIYFSPPEKEDGIRPGLEAMVGCALNAMGYTNGPSHTEVRYDVRGDRWIILETAFRVGFAGNIGKLYSEISGIPYNRLALRASLGQLGREEFDSIRPSSRRFGVLFTPATGSGGLIKSIGGQELLASDPRIVFHSFQKSVGDTVIAYPRGLEYLGVVLGVTDGREELTDLTETIARQVVFSYGK